jgi:hypothetical protein
MWRIAAMLCVFLLICSNQSNGQSGNLEVGWVEKVRLSPGNLVLNAKIDTGAKHSSINAYDVTEFNRGVEKWVRFKVTNRDGDSMTFERKVVRIARIKRRTVNGNENPGRHLRPVVMLGVCLGDVYREVEVSLADRRRFNYPMLIGRSFMSGTIVVDSSRKYTVEPMCKGTGNVE